MLALVSYVLLAAAAVQAAIEPCEPGGNPPPSTTSKPPTVPTGGYKQTTLTNRGKCMDVNGAQYQDGTKVQIYDCNGTGAQNWNMKRGSGHVTIGGGKYCLDAGTNPHDGSLVKIWTCYDGLQQQQWYYTNDNRLALDGLPYCLDLPSGNTANFQQLQIWTCGDNNQNQEWKSSLAVPKRRRTFARQQIADQLA